MLNIRIVRGPLAREKNDAILSEYNRLTSAKIPIEEFTHWVQDSPAGPAWHAFLERDDGAMVGHNSFIPFQVQCNGTRLVPAKSEYSFLREDYRAAKIRGFEKSGRPTWLIFADQLHLHCTGEGWGPLLISTSPAMRRWGVSNRCYPTEIHLCECLLVLRPLQGARKTPNLSRWQSAALFTAGAIQRTGWSFVPLVSVHRPVLKPLPIPECSWPKANGSLSFFQDPESLRWRYLEGQYERLALDDSGRQFLIVKRGSGTRYLRVCQWRLDEDRPIFPVVAGLVQRARQQAALGVRWAVYGRDQAALTLVRRLRALGFLHATRVRTLLIHTKEREFLSPDKWNLTDGMFSFDP